MLYTGKLHPIDEFSTIKPENPVKKHSFFPENVLPEDFFGFLLVKSLLCRYITFRICTMDNKTITGVIEP
jgi:hypothetical protein